MTSIKVAERLKKKDFCGVLSCTLPGDTNANVASYLATGETHSSTDCFSNRCSNNTSLEDKEAESTPRDWRWRDR